MVRLDWVTETMDAPSVAGVINEQMKVAPVLFICSCGHRAWYVKDNRAMPYYRILKLVREHQSHGTIAIEQR